MSNRELSIIETIKALITMGLRVNGFESCPLTTSCMMINPIHKKNLRKRATPGLTMVYLWTNIWKKQLWIVPGSEIDTESLKQKQLDLHIKDKETIEWNY